MSAEIPMISLTCRGKKFPRYVLAKSDDLRNPASWTGLNWTDNEAMAQVFADMSQVLWCYHDLLIEHVADRPKTSFVIPLRIEIFGTKPKLADLKEWLEKAVRIVVDTPKQGYGPDNTVGVVTIDFNKTRIVPK